MALSPEFPAPSGVSISSAQSRRALAGLVARDASGAPRAGILPRHANALVSARASMGVDVAAFEAVVVRNGLPGFISNDGAVTVGLGAAPSSNSRIDVVYVKQNESESPFSDANNTPTLGVVAGDVAATPVAKAVPAGALALAQVLIPSTATTTQSSDVVITQQFAYTAAEGGTVLVRNASELTAWTPGDGHYAHRMDVDALFVRSGGAWVELARATGWETYTPTWSTTGTAPAVGNGSLIGRFRRSGKSIEFRIVLTWGSTSAGGTGDFAFSLPVPASASGEQVGQTKAFTAGALEWFGGYRIGAGGSTVIPVLPGGAGADDYKVVRNADSGGGAGTGRPLIGGSYTFETAGRNLVIQGVYEAA